MPPRVDLHLHTDRSDGRFPLPEVLRRCAGRLDVIAITDHDLPPDVPTGAHEVEGHRLWLVGGAEVSGALHGREHHLLVFFPGEVPAAFREFCREQCRARAVRYAEGVERIGLPGVTPPSEAAWAGEVSLTRHHLARALMAAGHVRHVNEAFARFLADGHGLVPPIALRYVDAVRLARELGGVPVWAHPPPHLLEPCLRELVDAGLQGIEGMRPLATSADRRKARSAAKRFGLFLSGGSDWHGWGDDGELGLFRVEWEAVADLLRALGHASPPAGVAHAGP